jgi:hypothetical protein
VSNAESTEYCDKGAEDAQACEIVVSGVWVLLFFNAEAHDYASK